MSRIGYFAAGAAVGALLRWAVHAMWASTLTEYVATLVFAGLAGLAIGVRSHIATGSVDVVAAAAGTAAALGVAAVFAIGQSPLWFAVYLMAFPLCAATGFAVALFVGLRRGGGR